MNIFLLIDLHVPIQITPILVGDAPGDYINLWLNADK